MYLLISLKLLLVKLLVVSLAILWTLYLRNNSIPSNNFPVKRTIPSIFPKPIINVSDYILSYKSAVPVTVGTPRVHSTVSSTSITFFDANSLPHVTEVALDPVSICNDNATGFPINPFSACEYVVC